MAVLGWLDGPLLRAALVHRCAGGGTALHGRLSARGIARVAGDGWRLRAGVMGLRLRLVRSAAAPSSAMRHRVQLTVNGQACEEEVEPRTLLVQLLRERLGLTGTHVGCVVGECGACSVMVDGALVKSCLMLAVQADGREVTTIEGLASGGALAPIQEAFVANFALQCGFCTPGFVMASHALLQRNP